MPASLRASLSPLDGSPEADLYAVHLQHATFDPATSESFCKAAGLVVCSPDEGFYLKSTQLHGELLHELSSTTGLNRPAASDVQVLEPDALKLQGPSKIVSFMMERSPQRNCALCHTMGFLSQLYTCHAMPKTKVLEASLTATDRSLTRAVGICDMETSTWAPSYEAFTILNVQPSTPLCHWVDPDSLLWVSTK